MKNTITPHGEKLRNAIQWISEEKAVHPRKKRAALVDQAAIQFDLTPEESEFLYRFVTDSRSR